MTLLEIMLAMAIFTILALSATLIIVPVSRQARINREVATANCEAKRILEKVQAVPFSQILSCYPDGAELKVPSLPGGKVTTTYEDPEADPLILRVTLTWDSANLGTMTRTFTTLRTE